MHAALKFLAHVYNVIAGSHKTAVKRVGASHKQTYNAVNMTINSNTATPTSATQLSNLILASTMLAMHHHFTLSS